MQARTDIALEASGGDPADADTTAGPESRRPQEVAR
jgi:hypothetical protein